MTEFYSHMSPLAAVSMFQMHDPNSNGTSSNGMIRESKAFQTAFGACNFIVNWNGEDVGELLEAIHFARLTGDRFIQDKLIEYILNIPYRVPRPEDIPAFVGKPVWAVDHHGHALVGMPGTETIVDVSTLRQSIAGAKPNA